MAVARTGRSRRKAATLLVLALLGGAASPLLAQDALRGKRLYLDVGRLTGAGVSCVDCHLGLPPGLFGISRAANNPAIVEQAVNSVAPMAPLRGRLTSADYADLAAYIGDPGVPSPDLRVTTAGPASVANDTSRLEFGGVASGGASAASTVRLTNHGAVALTLVGAPQLAGNQPQDFPIQATDCVAGSTLQLQQSCSVTLVFRPTGADGARSASVRVAHDWVGGQAAVALLGTAGSAVAPPVGSGGGGSTAPAALAVLAASVLLRARAGRAR
jgi:mono/diheme cytochrome c family protein